MYFREATQRDYNSIYMMGYDTWSEGRPVDEYIDECQNSLKYKQGKWFVLQHKNQLLSSLILYKFSNNTFGIGSISTPRELREQGYASKLIQEVILHLEKESHETVIYLYSDINTNFYKKFNFLELDADAQRYNTTTCMVRAKNPLKSLKDKGGSPEYF
ncbi:MAG: GNAT family N-acetyltransferase [Bacteriovoracaceae bacterium]|jgi:predicted acetyltransferase|nr:GNAT family N-acetyltransferase [Bacteriovoracaceae bacterium]